MPFRCGKVAVDVGKLLNSSGNSGWWRRPARQERLLCALLLGAADGAGASCASGVLPAPLTSVSPSLPQAHLPDAACHLPGQEQHSGRLRVPALQPVRHLRYVGPASGRCRRTRISLAVSRLLVASGLPPFPSLQGGLFLAATRPPFPLCHHSTQRRASYAAQRVSKLTMKNHVWVSQARREVSRKQSPHCSPARSGAGFPRGRGPGRSRPHPGPSASHLSQPRPWPEGLRAASPPPHT